MTDLEKAKYALALAEQAFEAVQSAANEDRKTAHNKQIDGHYRKALEALDSKRKNAASLLKRVEAVGR